MKVPYVDLSLQWKKEKKLLLPIISRTLSEGIFVGGKQIAIFEKSVAKLCNKKFAIALNSGTDALTLALHLLGVKKGDEVITPPNSFISSTTSICHVGAKPVFVDVLKDQNIDPDLIEQAITKKTKAIMPVHLTGRVCDMNKINKISKKYNIPIVEDAAQSIGSQYMSKPSGSFGKINCFSVHPLKNLNACGDGGFMVTDDFKLYNLALKLRNHGLEERNVVNTFGFISRMDVLQANILNFRIKNLKHIIKKRRNNAMFYFENINRNFYFIPGEKKEEFNTYHTFVIQTNLRDKLKKYLKKNGVETAIHYPIPIHLQPAAKHLNFKKGQFPNTEQQAKRILTIPIHQNLKKKDLEKVVFYLNRFAKKNETYAARIKN